MIHKLVFFNNLTMDYFVLFDDQELDINYDLLIRLVKAMNILTESLGTEVVYSKGALQEIEMGAYQIGIKSIDEFVYTIFQDMYDNEPFSSKILTQIIEKTYPIARVAKNLNDSVPLLTSEISNIISTMKFPKSLLPKVQALVDKFHISTFQVVDTLFLADLDDGLVQIFSKKSGSNVISILMEIFSEIPFEKSWVAESNYFKNNGFTKDQNKSEIWFIYKLGLTDFTILGRGYITHEISYDHLISHIEELTDSLHQLIINYTL